MKKDISFLNSEKQNELELIIEIIKNSWDKILRAEQIIVFWEYIYKDENIHNFVQEWDQRIFYAQTMNILVITGKPRTEKNMKFSREITGKIKMTKEISSFTNILVEDIYSVREWIQEGRYFYLEIITSWILLYDSEKYKIKTNPNLTLEDIFTIKKENFFAWSEIAEDFFIDYQNAFQRWSLQIAIFHLHQCVELYMTCYLIVKTWYKPKTHDLEILYSYLKTNSKVFNAFFDLSCEDNYFQLLRWAYINARYNQKYEVKREELEFLEKRVLFLKECVRNLCLQELTIDIWNQEKN